MMTITEVSGRFDLSQDTLRYYERIGLIPRVNRTKSGIRELYRNQCTGNARVWLSNIPELQY